MPAPKVFVIDDDIIVRESLAIALGRHGFEVVAPSDLDPERLVEAAPAAQPDVVLLDPYLGT
ncbi:MAG: hypothetical protein JWN29_2065, partial [Acidimicrobiales bacterium]|nr:hypothetical protein [Acidimicrobiales bacterium]